MISLFSMTAAEASLKPMPMPVAPVAWEMTLLRDVHALGVHQIDADGVVVETVAFDHFVVVGEHEVDRVAAAPAEVVR
jgi:hypothetical protein